MDAEAAGQGRATLRLPVRELATSLLMLLLCGVVAKNFRLPRFLLRSIKLVINVNQCEPKAPGAHSSNGTATQAHV